MTRRKALVKIAGCTLGAPALWSACVPAAHARPMVSPFRPEARALLDLPEAKIDIGRAALIMGKEIYPAIDVDAYSKRIDTMASEAAAFVQQHAPRRDPDSIVRALNTYYKKVWQAHYDDSTRQGFGYEHNFLHHILNTHRGNCITIPMLYMAFAQRLGYSVFAVIAPEHTFLRYVDLRLREQNIELTADAGYEPDEGYAYRLNISRRGIESVAYLRTLTNREYLGLLIRQVAISTIDQGNYDKAIRYVEAAQELDPRDPYSAKNLCGLWIKKAKLSRDRDQAEKYLDIALRYYRQAEDLGWVKDVDANTRGKKR